MASFAVWLLDYFKHLPYELDSDVLGDYVTGILGESSGLESAELHNEIAELFSAYLPDDLAHKASKAIIDRYFSPAAVGQHPDGFTASTTTTTSGDTAATSLVDRMRSLLIAERERLKSSSSASTAGSLGGTKGGAQEDTGSRSNRDACTLAVLREAGVAGYQSNSDEERSLEIAMANADFQARQRLTVGVSADATPLIADGEDVVGDDVGIPEVVEVDMEELEQLSGYGRKPEAKAGTAADALAELGYSHCPPQTANGLADPPPMTFSLSALSIGPPRQLINGCCHSTASCVASSSGTGGRQRRGKKTHVTVPKHIARVGAQAEAESKRQQVASGATPSARGVRARRDEMDAFLFSDDDGECQKDRLPEGGHNRERVLASESAKRQTTAYEAAERRAKDKAERARQLTEASERRQAAQKRAQKVERRR